MQVTIDIPDNEITAAIERYTGGAPLTTVAGTSRAFRKAMEQVLINRGVPLRRRPDADITLNDDTFTKVEALRRQGLTWLQVGDTFDVGASTMERRYLRTIAKRAGATL